MTATQICAECGTRAEPGQSFCDGCGARPRRATAARSGGAPRAQRVDRGSPAALPAPASGSGTVGGSSAMDLFGDAPIWADIPASPPDREEPALSPGRAVPAPGEPASGDPASEEPASTRPDDRLTDRARGLLVPVADPQAPRAASPSAAPVLLARTVSRQLPAVRAPGGALGAGDGVPCPSCGTPNRSERHFCARCAMPMAGEEEAPGRRPWWRRPFGIANGETHWAGDRPRLRRILDRVLTWLGAALALLLLIVLVVSIPRGMRATRDHFAKPAPVSPGRVSASRSYPGHEPQLAFDKHNNTWWGPGVSQSGEGEWIEARFDQPVRLLDLLITSGVSTHADQLSQSALPHRVKATVETSDGKTKTLELSLDQGAGGQRRPFRFTDVTSVRFTLESAYGAGSDKQVAIAEIEFFGTSRGHG
ncbi:zinc ribbon domain-containing protein [Streptomyces sp. NPDC047022]|uniref:NADase-type glycan-binding domain-containing protein n=1 Tax=Streptomyces sp. NPDC047022 TaxID=3155737 RepID=UPI00340851D9